MRTAVLLAVAALALAFAPAPPPKPDHRAEADLEKMQGVWAIRERTDGFGSRRVEEPAYPCLEVFGHGLRTDAGGRHALTLDGRRSPRRFDLRRLSKEGRGRVYRGIYKLDGDTLTLCTETAGLGRPAAFAARGPGEVLEVYQRARPDALPREREGLRGWLFLRWRH
jgi:uncharacterized protein (TIGR03067 family)